MPSYTPSAWQALQSCATCAPVSGNDVWPWSYVAPIHVTVVWHCVQSVGNRAASWSGSVVASYSSPWQLTHSVGFPSYTPSAWQALQSWPTCAPVSGNEVPA